MCTHVSAAVVAVRRKEAANEVVIRMIKLPHDVYTSACNYVQRQSPHHHAHTRRMLNIRIWHTCLAIETYYTFVNIRGCTRTKDKLVYTRTSWPIKLTIKTASHFALIAGAVEVGLHTQKWQQ